MPQPIRDFVAGRESNLVLDPAESGWIPEIDLLGSKIKPDITFESTGESAGTVTIGKGFLATTLAVSIVDGKLAADTSKMPEELAGKIDHWVDDLNGQFADNGRQLGDASFADGKLTVTTVAVTSPTTGAAVVAPPAATTPATTTPAPAGDGEKGTKGKGTAKKVAATGGILAMLGLGGCWVLGGGDDSSSETPSETQGEETEVGQGESEQADEPAAETADETTEEAEEPADEPEVASADGDERTFDLAELVAAGQPVDMSHQATYDSDSFAVIGDDVPPPLLEVQASLFSIEGANFAAISGPSAVLNESTFELDLFTGDVQSPDGIDFVGADATGLSYFTGGLPLPEAGGTHGVILLPFHMTDAGTTDAGAYVGTTGMGLAEGTYAAIGGRMSLTDIPMLSQQFRQALEDRMNKTGSSVSDLIVTVTPVIFTTDD